MLKLLVTFPLKFNALIDSRFIVVSVRCFVFGIVCLPLITNRQNLAQMAQHHLKMIHTILDQIHMSQTVQGPLELSEMAAFFGLRWLSLTTTPLW